MLLKKGAIEKGVTIAKSSGVVEKRRGKKAAENIQEQR